MKILIIDNETRRNRFRLIVGNDTIVCSKIGQVCRELRDLCPDLPKKVNFPIPEGVRADMEAAAKQNGTVRLERVTPEEREAVVNPLATENRAHKFIKESLSEIKRSKTNASHQQ